MIKGNFNSIGKDCKVNQGIIMYFMLFTMSRVFYYYLNLKMLKV